MRDGLGLGCFYLKTYSRFAPHNQNIGEPNNLKGFWEQEDQTANNS
jgi:hypothetical protein